MNRLTSRKLWITIAAVVLPIVLDSWNVVNFGILLTPGLAAIVVTYLASQAWVDRGQSSAVNQSRNISKIAEGWKADALRNQKNVDYWRDRAEVAESKVREGDSAPETETLDFRTDNAYLVPPAQNLEGQDEAEQPSTRPS